MNRWDVIFESNPKYKPLNEVFFNILLNKIKVANNHKLISVVDLGCGSANTVFQFAKKGFEVVGIDYSKVALKKLQQRIDESGLSNIKLINEDLNNIQTKLSADIFLCNYVYSFIEKKALKKMTPHFAKPEIAAVLPCMKVKDPKNFLQKVQWYEY
ncbi:MAG: class I SAM-dependent methyltransferase, partial [Candidatus Izemoplasmatales bacterium]|nr:class I SAM-dependent methyltransferase [Candidatus Izemoplasmatales bacterium]